MVAPDDRQHAWNAYWRTQQAGCLPQSSPGLDALFASHWHGVARSLPEGAEVLDLGTGAGSVLKWMGEARDDLDLLGVDLAETLPPAPPGCRLLGGIAMEELPFDDGQFDAVVSQFGFEYGEMDRCAASAARVLQPNGILALVTHRADGPIVSHNRKRSAGISWAIETKRLADMAKSLISGAAQVTARQELAEAPKEAQARFGTKSAAWEIAEAIRRMVSASSPSSRDKDLGLIDVIAAKARGEMARIAALEAAADAVSDRAAFISLLETHSLALAAASPLLLGPDKVAVADIWILRRQ